MKNLCSTILLFFAVSCLGAVYNDTDWAGTNLLNRTNLNDLITGVGLATNRPVFYTSSSPTNQYQSGVVYTNTGDKGTLRGWSSGTILNHTNNGVNYPLPVTNNFYEPISTNDTFQFMTGTVTNVVMWR